MTGGAPGAYSSAGDTGKTPPLGERPRLAVGWSNVRDKCLTSRNVQSRKGARGAALRASHIT
eukprot:6566442-Prymnesium_polylepis.1